MNLLAGPVDDGAVRLGSLDLPLSDAQRAALMGSEVLVGVRPEGLVPVGDNQPGIRVVIDVVEELGSDTYLYCSTADGGVGLDAGRPITVRRDASSEHAGGDKLTLQPLLHAVHLFDAASGLRLPDT